MARYGSLRSIDLIGIVLILILLGAMLLPGLLYVREASRQATCESRLTAMAMAANGYHDEHGHFPTPSLDVETKGRGRWSQHVILLPHLGLQDIYDTIEITEGVIPQETPVSAFRCPSDFYNPTLHPEANNYRSNAGNDIGLANIPWRQELNNGVFVDVEKGSMRSDIHDGVSKTVSFSEAVVGDGNPQLCSDPSDWFAIDGNCVSPMQVIEHCEALLVEEMKGESLQDSKAGFSWYRGSYRNTRYNHVMPPNTRNCARPDHLVRIRPLKKEALRANYGGATTASSGHPGGVFCVFVDEHIEFISNDIGTRVWHAIASRNGGEVVEGSFSAW